tara:strand:+ start:1425 stop:1628 length:204 start_codon:yes stop_codon:yes gene_type:complete
MGLEAPDGSKTPRAIRKQKRADRRAKAAKKRAERLKNQDDKPSTYTTSSLDPNASVNHNAMGQAMFK